MGNRHMKYFKALGYARRKHEGTDPRKGTGRPYITHPVAVSRILRKKGFGTDYRIAGLFHDLLEDTDATEAEILELGNEDILEAVKLVTKEGLDTASYIDRISRNQMAAAVKTADRIHNLTDSAFHPGHDWKLKYCKESDEYYRKLAEMNFRTSNMDEPEQIFLKDFNEALDKLKDHLNI